MSEALDPNLWRPFIPQLLMSLSRPERDYILGVVLRLCKATPQAIYYQLRTLYHELRQFRISTPVTTSSGVVNNSNVEAEAEGGTATKRFKLEDDMAGDELGVESGGGNTASASTATTTTTGTTTMTSSGNNAMTESRTDPLWALKAVTTAVQSIRARHFNLIPILDKVGDEIVTQFKSTFEEELLHTTRVLLTECLKTAFAYFERQTQMLLDAKTPTQVC